MKKSKKILLILLAALLVAAVIGGICVAVKIVPTVNHGLRISELLQPVVDAENQTMEISLFAWVDDKPISLESDIYMVTEEDTRYLALEQNGTAIYVADHILFLENGRAFKLGETLQSQTVSYRELLPRIGALYDAFKITAEETDGETAYSVTVTGDQVDTILAAVSLGETLPADSIQTLNIRLTEKNGKLAQIRLAGSGELNGSAVDLDVTISGFRILASGDYPIPDAVKEAAATVDPNELFSLTEDLYRLALALTPLADLESVDGSLELRVDCGLIQLDTEMRLADLKTDTSGQLDPDSLKALPEMIGLLCMEGEISCVQTCSAYVYTLELDKAAMGQLFEMVLPELQQYGGDLTEGAVTIQLEGGAISSLDIAIAGSINALIAQIPIAVGATFSFD